MTLRVAIYCGAALILLGIVATCYGHRATERLAQADRAAGAAQIWTQQADQQHAKADIAAAKVAQIRPRREQLAAKVVTMITLPPEPLELIQVQAQEIQALETEVLELRGEGVDLRQALRAKIDESEALRQSMKDLNTASVTKRLVIGGVSVGVVCVGIFVWRRR